MMCKLSARQYAAVAQLDRVFGYEPKGRGFESLQPYQKQKDCLWQSYCFWYQGGRQTAVTRRSPQGE